MSTKHLYYIENDGVQAEPVAVSNGDAALILEIIRGAEFNRIRSVKRVLACRRVGATDTDGLLKDTLDLCEAVMRHYGKCWSTAAPLDGVRE